MLHGKLPILRCTHPEIHPANLMLLIYIKEREKAQPVHRMPGCDTQANM